MKNSALTNDFAAHNNSFTNRQLTLLGHSVENLQNVKSDTQATEVLRDLKNFVYMVCTLGGSSPQGQAIQTQVANQWPNIKAALTKYGYAEESNLKTGHTTDPQKIARAAVTAGLSRLSEQALQGSTECLQKNVHRPMAQSYNFAQTCMHKHRVATPG